MITPADIRDKAERIYARAILAWLTNDTTFFPYRLPVDLSLPESQADLVRQTENLRAESKALRGFGYTIRWEEIQKRKYGKNHYPTAILVESLEDLLRLTRRLNEFQQLNRTVEHVRQRLPALESWIVRHWRRLLQAADAVPDLLAVTEYLMEHPRPDCFLRELPLSMSTKVVECNQSLLREWWDLVLPANAIDFGCDPRYFEQRYGFRYVRPHLLVRLLDEQLKHELQFPAAEISLPVQAIAALPGENLRVFIVENKVNWLTLPPLRRVLAFGGLGKSLTQLFAVEWLRRQPIFYWGDMDQDGFEMLAMLRHAFPGTTSLLMDPATLDAHRAFTTTRAFSDRPPPSELTPPELAAYTMCRDQQLRLEQEHIPQWAVERRLAELFLEPFRVAP